MRSDRASLMAADKDGRSILAGTCLKPVRSGTSARTRNIKCTNYDWICLKTTGGPRGSPLKHAVEPMAGGGDGRFAVKRPFVPISQLILLPIGSDSHPSKSSCLLAIADRHHSQGPSPMMDLNGRGERIRTSDTCVPNAVLYQAELHPDM